MALLLLLLVLLSAIAEIKVSDLLVMKYVMMIKTKMYNYNTPRTTTTTLII